MRHRSRSRAMLVPSLSLMLVLGASSRLLGAQGITSAALHGTVAQADGGQVSGAVVKVTAVRSGASWQAATDGAGWYFLENVQVGGPYQVEARALGFAPVRREGIVLALGQRSRVDFVLERAAITLRPVTIDARVDPLLNAGRTGPAHIVSAEELAALPNVVRDLSVAAAIGPLAVVRPLGGISIAGQNQGFNSLQVDGGVNADLYLGRTPGGASPSGALPEVLPHAISLETVSEFQVLAAPFDVRLGRFTGGLLNAVTKSGSNDVRASAFGYLQSGSLAARNAAGIRPSFTTSQFGISMSGPIVRDRVHFFVNADLQRRVVPDAGPLATDIGRTGARDTSAFRFQRILRDGYGLDAGTPSSAGHLPAQDFFAKVSMQLGATGHLELSQRYAHGDRRGFIDVGRTFDSTALSSVSGRSRSTVHTSRLIWTTLVSGRAQNELIVSFARLHDACQPNAAFPLIQVNADSGTLIAGPNSVCPTTDVRQHALELTDNLTLGAGAHVVTLGSQIEVLRFRDPLVQVSAGRWDFLSLDSLERGEASHYDRGLASAFRAPGADFRALNLGAYVQDRWAPTRRLTLTAGVRLDIPTLPDAPPTNSTLVATSAVDTGRLPSGNVLWSPRVGMNYDLTGDGATFLRGGIGLFSGPPPYRWLGNAYRESGDESVVLCDRPVVPLFTPDAQPLACSTGGGRSPRVSYLDADLRLPQNLKLAVGLDRLFPWNVVGTVDLLITHAVHQLYVTQANLGAPVARASGEGGRLLYGTVGPLGLASPAWRDTTSGLREVYRVSNARGDHSLSLSAQLRRRFGERLALFTAYAYSRARDRMSIVNFPSRANFSNTPLDGPIDSRELRPSFFETPHKVSATATLTLPYRAQLALLYLGASQPPYTFVVNGDANADGIGGSGSLKNDIVYVPLGPGDVSLMTAADSTRLEAFIQQHRCLREQRGRIMARGSCRNGWLGMLNARITKSVRTSGWQRLELSADVVNLPNLLNPRWGRQRDITTNPSVTMMMLAGWNAERDRGRYRLPARLPVAGIAEDMASRWRVQLGARYHLDSEGR